MELSPIVRTGSFNVVGQPPLSNKIIQNVRTVSPSPYHNTQRRLSQQQQQVMFVKPPTLPLSHQTII